MTRQRQELQEIPPGYIYAVGDPSPPSCQSAVLKQPTSAAEQRRIHPASSTTCFGCLEQTPSALIRTAARECKHHFASTGALSITVQGKAVWKYMFIYSDITHICDPGRFAHVINYPYI